MTLGKLLVCWRMSAFCGLAGASKDLLQASLPVALLVFAGLGAPCGYAQSNVSTAAPESPVQSISEVQPRVRLRSVSDRKSSSGEHDTRITPEQAQELFRSVDSILKFDSKITGLPILHPVKRRLVTRDQVVEYLQRQLQHGHDAQRLERSALVLKKFGLLPQDFALRPFLVKLLREQIAGYYDDKTDTVNLLDWVPPKEQKPVLAHELTHALQDQHVPLRKWGQQSDLSIAKNVQQDNAHIATDETDTARNAVVEGQAMVSFVDYALAPAGKTLLDVPPEMTDRLNEAMAKGSGSPVLSSAPLVLRESLLFPYADGLKFVRAVLASKGKQAAFAGLLDDPPSSTYEIMTPEVYLRHQPVPRLHMPDIHPLIQEQYRPYDVGVIGEFDVQVIAQQFGGEAASRALTPAWRGGIYYAAQSRSAKSDAERDLPGSLGLLYLSRWATPKSARSFAELYAKWIPQQYPDAKSQQNDAQAGDEQLSNGSNRLWQTTDGPVLIAVSGSTVFVSESFPLPLALKLEPIMMGSVAGSSSSQVAEFTAPTGELTSGLRGVLGRTALLRRMSQPSNVGGAMR